MLHNHLRNFTSHKFIVDLDAPDKADHGPHGVHELRAGVEIAGYHVGSLRDTGNAVALRDGRGDGGKEKRRRKKNLFLAHNSIIFECGAGMDRPRTGFNFLIRIFSVVRG